MKTLLVLGGASAALLAQATLGTDYEREREVRTTSETTLTSETTDVEMIRDGEPVEGRFGGGGENSETRSVITVDRVLETEDGAPIRVRRFFEEIEGVRIQQGREGEVEIERDAPLEEAVIEISPDGVEVVEGDEPDHEGALEGHQPTLVLEGLLPGEDVDPGDSWELESDAILAALGIDLERAFFAPPSREGRGERGQGGGGGGRRGGGRGGQGAGFLNQAEWEGTATLLAEETEHEGQDCLVIELAIEASGSYELPEGGRRGGGGGGLALASESARANEAEYEVELEGQLLFSSELALPVFLELEGDYSVDTTMEREMRDGGEMSIYTRREGSLEHAVTIEQIND